MTRYAGFQGLGYMDQAFLCRYSLCAAFPFLGLVNGQLLDDHIRSTLWLGEAATHKGPRVIDSHPDLVLACR
jgi:hypothetical protein